ncbi:aspartate aminotransferase family protein [Paraburkholderia sp. JHI2823]|uniref:aspartate aminotransferase family protein n=1 Tax=Paraburkholderia sp. JHI2823 TaxID=3112960 RepID=UPI00317B06FD
MSKVEFKGGTTIAAPKLPKVQYGRGVYVFDTTGKQYIDGSSGPAVYSLGHGNEEVNEAVAAQLRQIAHGYRYLFTSDPLEELSDLVREACGPDFTSMVFVSGGSEAVESALKLALQYHSALGNSSRRRFISRQRSWHGNTLGALSISGFLERRAPFEGALIPASLISPANEYRPLNDVPADELGRACADELEQEILRIGADNVAAFVFEPVVGAAGGVVPAPKGYAKAVREVCDRHGVLMIADEVMCGSGRCGTWRALEFDDVVPDIMPIAKGLGGGYIPLGATVYTKKVAEVINGAYGGPMTGHTFTGHTAACAAGVAVQKIIKRDRLMERVQTAGQRFGEMLRAELAGIGAVGDIRGRGFFWGVEFVEDLERKTPFAAEKQLYLKIRQRSLANGLICYPSGGNVDGVLGDTVILAPPYIATDDELAEIVEKFARSSREALSELGR